MIATETVTLPSGCTVEMRPIRVAEENILAAANSKRSVDVGRVLTQVVDACITEITQPGPYDAWVAAGGRADWRRMLSGDKLVAMLELRKISYRDGHHFTALDVECPSRTCPTFDFDIDLTADIIRRDISAEAAERVRSGEPFTCQIAGNTVSFVLGTGATEETTRKLALQHPDRVMAAGLRARIVDVSGVERRDILDWIDGANGKSKSYPGLSSQDAEDLRDALDLVECGIDTDVTIVCPRCGKAYVIQLPFDSGFLMPSRAIRERQRARRVAASSDSRDSTS